MGELTPMVRQMVPIDVWAAGPKRFGALVNSFTFNQLAVCSALCCPVCRLVTEKAGSEGKPRRKGGQWLLGFSSYPLLETSLLRVRLLATGHPVHKRGPDS